MGYACPVCDDPQADAEHLANHLAFTAMLRGDGHEAWLDDHVDDWADLAPEELAEGHDRRARRRPRPRRSRRTRWRRIAGRYRRRRSRRRRRPRRLRGRDGRRARRGARTDAPAP
ncbi:hypothetical protein BRC79_02495 [Halobacteriales archaeon QH_8_67_27]|nr:MAG: hypothetical protein BRC79_02495 [Halobacteriales archaeon QH_8_67_27]